MQCAAVDAMEASSAFVKLTLRQEASISALFNSFYHITEFSIYLILLLNEYSYSPRKRS